MDSSSFWKSLMFIILLKQYLRKTDICGVTFSMTSSFSFTESHEDEGNCKLFKWASSLASSRCSCFTNAFSDITTLTCALVLTCLAQLAKRRVFLDCSTWLCAGLMVQIMAVLAFPPREFCNIRVSFESLNGTCPFFPLLH